ncbi:MAG: hypothetical protein GY867_09100 [bacterium]|nr:hypothetical protein [bacterium]
MHFRNHARIYVYAAASILLLSLAGNLSAEVPPLINYQGRLTNSMGEPMDTLVDMTFSLYADPDGTTLLWTENHPVVEVYSGLFHIVLGGFEPIPDTVFTGEVRWLGIQVGSDPEGEPRATMVTVPYAYRAWHAQDAQNSAVADFSLLAESVVEDAVGSPQISNGSINLEDLGHNYASEGMVIKWVDDGWAMANDSIGGGSFTLPYSGTVSNAATAFDITNSGVGSGSAVKGVSDSSDAVVGQTNHAGKSGVYGFSSSGFGVTGRCEGDNHGVLGWTQSLNSDHAGVRAINVGQGPGLSAQAANYGVKGTATNGSVGIGVFGKNTNNGFGGWFEATGTGGIGLHAYGAALAGNFAGAVRVLATGEYAGYFYNDSADADAVLMAEYGGTGHTSAAAVSGICTPRDRSGVGGYFKAGWKGIVTEVEADGTGSPPNDYYGIWCDVSNTGTSYPGFNSGISSWVNGAARNYGVYSYVAGGGVYNCALLAVVNGPDSAENYAGYFDGDVAVTGTVSQNVSTFKIDHPLDPENSYLSHASVVSPELKTVYDGVTVLDDAGTAEVRMPEYFSVLNRDFRYQLTCIGGYAPVYVAEEIFEGRFTITGGEPGLKVSWQVTGIRDDVVARTSDYEIESAKPFEARGKYLYPEARGLGSESKISTDIVEKTLVRE